METYVERIKANAENLAKEVFPKKALELDDLINVIPSSSSNLHWVLIKFIYFFIEN